MAKAINWPKEFRDEILQENKDEIKIALRIGPFYAECGYYEENDIVDIRADEEILRKASIPCPPKVTTIKNLATSDLYRLKEVLRDKDSIVNFLSKTYNKEVDENSEITVITYKNLGIVVSEDNF